MHLLKQSIILIVCLYVVHAAKAQSQFAGWTSFLSFTKINKSFTIEFDGTVHSTDKWEQVQSFQFWAGLLYYFNPHWSVGLGYSVEEKRESVSNVTGIVPDSELWEQLVASYPLRIGSGKHERKGTLYQRLRLEDRFIPELFADGSALKTQSTIFSTRLRYLLRTQTPIIPTDSFTKGPYFVFQDELYLNTSGSEKLNTKFIDQDRGFVAGGYRFSKQMDVEFGYLLQYSQTKSSTSKNNILQLSALIHL
jgi:hypothetical protein